MLIIVLIFDKMISLRKFSGKLSLELMELYLLVFGYSVSEVVDKMFIVFFD